MTTSLTASKKWIVIHPCGRCIPGTEADDPLTPVRIVCGALPPHDWDEMKDQGYRLSQRSVKAIAREAARKD